MKIDKLITEFDDINSDWIKTDKNRAEELALHNSLYSQREVKGFVTIDDRIVFIGGPSGGSGGTSGSIDDEFSPTQAELREDYITGLCKNMDRDDIYEVRGWLENVPDEDLLHVNDITMVITEGDLKRAGYTNIHMNEDGFMMIEGGADEYASSHDYNAIGFCDTKNEANASSIVLSEKQDFTESTFIHEVGHAVIRDNRRIALGEEFVWAVKNREMFHDAEPSERFLTKLHSAGLREYSLTNGSEFMADAYRIRTMLIPEINQQLDSLWDEYSYARPPLRILVPWPKQLENYVDPFQS